MFQHSTNEIILVNTVLWNNTIKKPKSFIIDYTEL
jgi:hypothetical protein